jgi:hypothetical protein
MLFTVYSPVIVRECGLASAPSAPKGNDSAVEPDCAGTVIHTEKDRIKGSSPHPLRRAHPSRVLTLELIHSCLGERVRSADSEYVLLLICWDESAWRSAGA